MSQCRNQHSVSPTGLSSEPETGVAMTRCYALQQRLRDSRGVTLLWVAILLTVFIGIAALAIDVGYLAVARNESQNGADAAALAGARRLGENYLLKISPRSTDVTTAAQATAALNQVAAKNLAANNAGTQIGTWDPSAKTFDATAVDYPNAVQVDVKREAGLTNGPISTFLCADVGCEHCEQPRNCVCGAFRHVQCWHRNTPGHRKELVHESPCE